MVSLEVSVADVKLLETLIVPTLEMVAEPDRLVRDVVNDHSDDSDELADSVDVEGAAATHSG